MTGGAARWFAGTALACAVAGCGGTQSPEVVYGGPPQSDDVARGQQEYTAVCAPCHEDPNNRRAPMLSGVHLPPWALRRQVREGDLWMTAIPRRRLDDAELEAVLAYFASTGTCVIEREEATGDDRWGPGTTYGTAAPSSADHTLADSD